MKKLILFLSILFTVFFAASPSVGFAQNQETAQPPQAGDTEASVEATLSPTDEDLDIFVKERETEKIIQLRDLYRKQAEVYRAAEKEFVIAKTNFEQVQTLASLEEAVKKTKQVMQVRTEVLITYLELLEAVLKETNGIELDLKQQSQTELIGLIQALKIHQDDIAVSNDRQAMAVLANDFEPIAITFESEVYKALSLIRIGRIQEVHDKSEIIFVDIQELHESQESTASAQAKRNRAYAEIERNFDSIVSDLVDLNEKFLQARRDGFSRSFYTRTLEDLSPVYAEISRSLGNLEELIEL